MTDRMTATGINAFCLVHRAFGWWSKKYPGGRSRPGGEEGGTTGDELLGLRRAGGRTPRGGNHLHGLDRLGDLRTRRGARHVARLDDEALLERLVDPLFDGNGFLADNLGDFGDDQRPGAIEHPLLAERQALRLDQEGEALEHVGHVVDRARAHLV